MVVLSYGGCVRGVLTGVLSANHVMQFSNCLKLWVILITVFVICYHQ